jgi:hypothetical protein
MWIDPTSLSRHTGFQGVPLNVACPLAELELFAAIVLERGLSSAHARLMMH